MLYRKHGHAEIEFKALLAFWGWFVLSRIINGDYALQKEYNQVLDLALMLPAFALGITLKKERRGTFLNWFSAIVGGYFFVLGCVCIYSFSQRIDIPNTITQQFIVSTLDNSDFTRICILDTNVDATAFWFLESFLLMDYQFFACRKKAWRIPIFLSAAVDYIVIGMTYTRSVFIAVSAAVGLSLIFALNRKLSSRKKGIRYLFLFFVLLIAMFGTYKGFYRSTEYFGRMSVERRYQDATEEEKEEIFQGEFTDTRRSKSINQFTSGRFWIYRAGKLILQRNLSIWLHGCLYDESALLLTETMKEGGGSSQGGFVPHYQNFLLQVLVVDGLPGLLLVLLFCLSLLYKEAKLFFRETLNAEAALLVLGLSVATPMLYGMLESCFFTVTDVRTLFFFLMSGLFLGSCYDKISGNNLTSEV
ncbi:MAG: O-antigen ligase family protein [Oscillospiraceae bacterium]|nr:O-antigen ligase family protein [Oscillospiraceae bacterium]